MQELRKLEAEGQLVSTKRTAKAKIAEELGPEDAEEVIRLAGEVKRLAPIQPWGLGRHRHSTKVAFRPGYSFRTYILILDPKVSSNVRDFQHF